MKKILIIGRITKAQGKPPRIKIISRGSVPSDRLINFELRYCPTKPNENLIILEAMSCIN